MRDAVGSDNGWFIGLRQFAAIAPTSSRTTSPATPQPGGARRAFVTMYGLTLLTIRLLGFSLDVTPGEGRASSRNASP